MKTVFNEQFKVALDVGTTKIVALVSRRKSDGTIEIIGSGKSPSHGLKKGVVVDIEKTVASIKTAIAEAELVAGCSIEAVSVGISGSHICAINSHGAVPIRKRIVQHADIQSVVQAAKAIMLPEGQQIIHVLPRYFRIDGSERLANPLGMNGVRLEAEVHLVTASVSAAQNLVHCCEIAGLRVEDIVLEHIASAEAVCSKDEQELGVGLLDIGGGTSDFAVYQQGAVVHTHVIPVAGNLFTSDVAIGLQTTLAEAAFIKEKYGSAVPRSDMDEILFDYLQVSGSGKTMGSQELLVAILQPRAEELFRLLNRVIRENQLYAHMTTGLVLTGGGALLQGIVEVAHRELLLPVRVGKPHAHYYLPVALDNPVYATAYGLVLYAWKEENSANLQAMQGPLMNRVFARMKSWVADIF